MDDAFWDAHYDRINERMRMIPPVSGEPPHPLATIGYGLGGDYAKAIAALGKLRATGDSRVATMLRISRLELAAGNPAAAVLAARSALLRAPYDPECLWASAVAKVVLAAALSDAVPVADPKGLPRQAPILPLLKAALMESGAICRRLADGDACALHDGLVFLLAGHPSEPELRRRLRSPSEAMA